MGNKQKPNNKYEIIEKNILNTIEWQENITVLDLSNREITRFDDNVKLPSNLVDLNLSKNKFAEIPTTVLNLENLKTLDLSYNSIVLFDDTPNFCHSIESLNLLNNKLEGPPYWIWAEKPKHLIYLNLSYNKNICHSFVNYYFEELLQYKTLVKEIHIHNCRLGGHKKLISTFRDAKIINLGSTDYDYHSVNHIEAVPCVGLEDCYEIEKLNLLNTNIYNVQHNIDIYQNLLEINLSQNNINCLPNEFCNLKNLEVCILSHNKILYLPDNMHNLKRLIKLYLDDNELCMLPEKLNQIDSLRILDLYKNHLYESVEDIGKLEQYDFAQNYGDEPSDVEYLEKKQKLRVNCTGRRDGRIPEMVIEESENSEDEYYKHYDLDMNDGDVEQEVVPDTRCSSPEDWDSDDHWIPSLTGNVRTPPLRPRQTSTTSNYTMQWLDFVKKKMQEGNFCPMDTHLSISITEQVRYEKMCNPQPMYESDGQFDDFSDDDT